MKSSIEFPKITVVTPSFNQGLYLDQTICSVINQGYPNLEYIIMDGGSSDDSVGIIKKYASHLFYWQSCSDRGQTSAVNAGFTKGTGELLTFINSDDLLLPGSLHRAARYAVEYPSVAVFYGDLVFIDAGSTARKCYYYPPVYKWVAWNNMFLPQPGVFFRRRVWELVGGFDESLGYAFDRDFWFRLLQADCRFASLGIPTAAFRKHVAAKGLVPAWAARALAENQMLEKRYLRTSKPADRLAARSALYALQVLLFNYQRHILSRWFKSRLQRLVNAAATAPRGL